MQVVAVVNRRGGVGKTVTAHALGAGLKQKGKKVLYIDLDSQMNLTYDTGAENTEPTAMEMLTRQVSASETIAHTAQGDIIPASAELSTADIAITETGKEYRLKEAIDGLKYDFIIIDTPPALGILTTNALTAADRVIIPAQAEIHSLQGIGLLKDTLDAVRKYTNPKLKIDGILLTRYNSRAIISQDMRTDLEEMAKQMQTRVYDAPIRECTAIKEAQALQQDIFTYAPRSNAAKDYSMFITQFTKSK